MMMWFGKYWILVCSLLCTVSALAGDVPEAPTWPLDLSTRYLTSNFMEFRSGRFHAGLDLKTQSREGFTVRAVEDGYISRIRCTPTAYGRVVYLRGDSGKTFVFAHLARFNDDLRQRVEEVQQAGGTYRARLQFKPDQIRVKKGQVLGVSGQSGTGGPHLHFEVRDRNQRPINPLDHGFEVEDLLPPVIHSLRAWPVMESSRINGARGEWVLRPEQGSGLSGDLGVLNISGPVAFSSSMIDASDIRGHKLEPRLIELSLDGELIYRCLNSRYAFDENSLQRLEWTDQARPANESTPREHWLHRRQANTLTGREGELWYLGKGGAGLSNGDHEMVLRVLDHAGNMVSVRWTLRVQNLAEPVPDILWKSRPMGVQGAEPAVFRLTPFFSSGQPEKAGFKVLNLSPENGDEVLEKVELWVRTVGHEKSLLAAAASQGLTPVGDFVEYLAADWPIESSVPVFLPGKRIILSKNDGKSPTGVYRFSRKNEWELVTVLPQGEVAEFLLEEPGLHGVFQDREPPVYAKWGEAMKVQLAPVSTVPDVTFSKWMITTIGLVDAGSGVDTGSITAQLNGHSLILEPDPPRDRLLVHWPDNMAAGKNLLFIESTDQAGNSNAATYHIQAQESTR